MDILTHPLLLLGISSWLALILAAVFLPESALRGGLWKWLVALVVGTYFVSLLYFWVLRLLAIAIDVWLQIALIVVFTVGSGLAVAIRQVRLRRRDG